MGLDYGLILFDLFLCVISGCRRLLIQGDYPDEVDEFRTLARMQSLVESRMIGFVGIGK